MKLLIAYDGSEGSGAALEGLMNAGLRNDTEAVILTVADFLLPPAAAETAGSVPTAQEARIREQVEHRLTLAKAAIAEAQATAAAGAERVRELFPAWNVRAEAVCDSPGWGVVRKADEWKADLIVVGACSHSALSRVLLGSVSHSVLIHARCSVRINRPGPGRPGSACRLIVGLDGSSGSQHALDEIAGRSWPSGSEARVITAVDNRMISASPSVISGIGRWFEDSPEDDDGEAWIHRMCKDAVARLQSAGLQASYQIEEGNPIDVIVTQVAAWQADAVFAGARGLSGAGRLLLGSVSTSIAQRAKCSVEIVHPKRDL